MLAALPVLTLPVAMIESSFRALLVPAIRAAPLTEPRLLAAGEAAIALPAIATWAEKKDGVTVTAQANPLPENHLAVNRHACVQAVLDNGNRFVAG